MRRIVVGLLGTLSGLVMLFSYHTSTQGGSGVPRLGNGALGGGSGAGSLGGLTGGATGGGSTAQGGAAGQGGADPNAGGGSTAQQNGAGGSSSGSSGSSSDGKIVKGDTAGTRWGPVQVAIRVASGRIAGVDAIVYPTDNSRDQEINSYAVPALNQEVMDAQSANIDMISGATVTSRGYISSLQSALDKAGI
jgi:uncharacterized protein with FMN-binding domain